MASYLRLSVPQSDYKKTRPLSGEYADLNAFILNDSNDPLIPINMSLTWLTSLGELLFDFKPCHGSLYHHDLFSRFPHVPTNLSAPPEI